MTYDEWVNRRVNTFVKRIKETDFERLLERYESVSEKVGETYDKNEEEFKISVLKQEIIHEEIMRRMNIIKGLI